MIAGAQMREAQRQYGGHPRGGCDGLLSLLHCRQTRLKGPDCGIGVSGIHIAICLTCKGFRSGFCRLEDKTGRSENGLGVLLLRRTPNAGTNGPRARTGFCEPISVI